MSFAPARTCGSLRKCRISCSNEPSLALGPLDDWPRIFEERLVVLACSLLTPFYINDMIFYGRKNDVSKLISFDIGCEMIYSNMAPRAILFRPFVLPGVADFPLVLSVERTVFVR